MSAFWSGCSQFQTDFSAWRNATGVWYHWSDKLINSEWLWIIVDLLSEPCKNSGVLYHIFCASFEVDSASISKLFFVHGVTYIWVCTNCWIGFLGRLWYSNKWNLGWCYFKVRWDRIPSRGFCNRNQRLACSVLYLKSINTFFVLKNNICIL